MEVLLVKDVEKLGRKGELVSVRDGYARNFLIPHALAILATRENQRVIEGEKKRATLRAERRKEDSEKLAQQIASLRLSLEVAVGEKEKLFGSVTAQQIAGALKRQGVVLDKRRIHLPEPIHSLGTHAVTIELEGNVKLAIQVEIIKSKKK